MEYIAFKAHKTRGPEIIKILESWGGVNIKGLDATWETRESVKIVYYVTHYNTIGYNPPSLVKSLGYKIYTLEEYEAMNKEKKYQEGYAQGYEDAVKTEMMYKEKEKQELLFGLVPVANKGQELIPHKDYEIKQDGEKFYLVKKRKKYPKTYEECAEIIAEFTGSDCNPKGCMGYMSVQLTALQKLLVCRDAYWKIAGEEMGLGKPWEPDYDSGVNKYGIICMNGVVQESNPTTNWERHLNKVLDFPTAEMRDAFDKNFGPDLDKCKELI